LDDTKNDAPRSAVCRVTQLMGVVLVTLQETTSKPRRNLRPNEPLSRLLDDQVLTLEEWRRINRLSERTARKILSDPDPSRRPKLTMLTTRRKGVTVRANREWQQARTR
jgi:hypothetical protein